ncbi:CUB and sushi domain-containing protein 1-like [Sycon ciliatum]|uniref:CUB and sushi domain-containing protein 1-like n=1 Tax=Sycon ciliatum TaxID=27933 RepID=UPI0031F6694D
MTVVWDTIDLNTIHGNGTRSSRAHTCNVPTLAHGNQSNKQSEIEYGMDVKYTCEVGYKMNGPALVNCTANGLSATTTCELHTCHVPKLAHGRQNNKQSEIEYGMTVAYTCEVGYWMNGPATVTCTANGLSGHTSCFGYYRSETRRANGDLRCPVGMYLSVPPMSYLPEGPGSQKTLSEAKGICQALHMTLPPRSAAHCLWDFAYHSTVGIDIGYEGVWADYWLSSSADVEYKVKLRSGGDVDRERGSVICYVHACNVPKLAHGRQNNTESVIRHGTTVAYTCDVGYKMNGPATVTCTANGLSANTTCQVLTCHVPKLVDGSQNNTEPVIQYGMTVAYTCNVGHRMLGSARATCTANGLSAETPFCRRWF